MTVLDIVWLLNSNSVNMKKKEKKKKKQIAGVSVALQLK